MLCHILVAGRPHQPCQAMPQAYHLYPVNLEFSIHEEKYNNVRLDDLKKCMASGLSEQIKMSTAKGGRKKKRSFYGPGGPKGLPPPPYDQCFVIFSN